MSELNNNENNDILLSVKDLYVEYTSDKKIIHAVNGVSFDIKKGKTLGLVGETGAGKTTIAKSIIGILPVPPAKLKSGEIYYEGQEITKLNEKEMSHIQGEEISMIFQDPMTALNPTMTVGAQIADGIALHENLSKVDSIKKAKQMLELVGIPSERFTEYPHQFSGGMKQRVVIAIALACNPQLILADEPTTALDVTIQAQVLELIKDLQKKQETSMLLITHDLGVVAQTCDDVAVIYAGEIVESGDKYEIFDHPSHPYTLGLFGSLPNMVKKGEKRLHPIAGMMPNPSNLPGGCKFHPRCPYATEECTQDIPELKNIGGTHACRCIHAGNLVRTDETNEETKEG
ncbi:MAG: ABC transporter ATP-binding protein [Lachnospiraceae bacterium]|nr:ABC transporter ATP-binding protein [Lachnospiraceae bacterium]